MANNVPKSAGDIWSRKWHTARSFEPVVDRYRAQFETPPPDAATWAGAYMVDITPETFGFPIGAGTDRIATGAGDGLWARALVFGNEESGLVFLVSLDWLGLSYNFAKRFRAVIANSAGTTEDQVFLLCSHTHSAPDLLGYWGGLTDDGYFDFALERVLHCVCEAAKAMEPATLRIGTSRIPEMVTHFAGGNDPIDDQLTVLRFQNDSGSAIATFIVVPFHPETGSGASEMAGPLVSGEFSGYLARLADDKLGGVTLLANGAIGDAIPRFEIATPARGSNLSAQAQAKTAEWDRFGKRMISIINDMEFSNFARSVEIAIGNEVFQTPCENPYILDEYLSRGYFREIKDGCLTTEVARIGVGSIEMAFFPGELHGAAKQELIESMTGSFNIVISLANDCIGYLIPTRCFRPGEIKEMECLGPNTWNLVREKYKHLALQPPSLFEDKF